MDVTGTRPIEYPPVQTKKDFVLRYQKGEFGNRSPTWQSLYQFREADPKGLFHLRNRVAGGETHYDLDFVDVLSMWSAKKDRNQWYVSQMAPTEKTLIQGELVDTPEGLRLHYTTVAKPMRDALKEQSHEVTGITALSLLQYYMDPSSYDWIHVLLDRYPSHVIEFSVYGCNFGTIPNRNTIIWEVRSY